MIGIVPFCACLCHQLRSRSRPYFFRILFVGVCQVAAAKMLDTWFTKDKVLSLSRSRQVSRLRFCYVFVVDAALGLHKSLLLVAFAYIVLWSLAIIGKDGPVAASVEAPPKQYRQSLQSSYVWLLSIAASCTSVQHCSSIYVINAFVSRARSCRCRDDGHGH